MFDINDYEYQQDLYDIDFDYENRWQNKNGLDNIDVTKNNDE